MGARSLAPPGSRRQRTRPPRSTARPSFRRPASAVYLCLLLLLFLLALRDRLQARHPYRNRAPGTPASALPSRHGASIFPTAYFGVEARFLFYTSAYGQFNNQVVSLINALFLARHADSVLVLPYAKLGKESSWDIARAGLSAELDIARELVGDYFNYTRLLSAEHVVRPTAFFASTDAADLLSRPNITVNYRSGNAYRKLLAAQAAAVARQRRRAPTEVLSPPHDKNPLRNFCDFYPDHALATVADHGRNGRFTFLPIVFRRHSLNCTREEPDWVSIRRSLVPRDEYLHAVDAFLATLARPILAVHLRIFLNGDVLNSTPRSIVDMLFRDFGPHLMRARTLFVAYSPSSDVSREAFAMLKERFHGAVVDGSRTARFFPEKHKTFASLALTNVLLDMWVCVKSDMFLGRLGSSLSWNTVFWRQALREEYGLDIESVGRPLWYTLRNFTTTAAKRNEGPLLGANLAHMPHATEDSVLGFRSDIVA